MLCQLSQIIGGAKGYSFQPPTKLLEGGAGHLIDSDHVAAQPIGALPAYADLAEFQPRRGSDEACFAS